MENSSRVYSYMEWMNQRMLDVLKNKDLMEISERFVLPLSGGEKAKLFISLSRSSSRREEWEDIIEEMRKSRKKRTFEDESKASNRAGFLLKKAILRAEEFLKRLSDPMSVHITLLEFYLALKKTGKDNAYRFDMLTNKIFNKRKKLMYDRYDSERQKRREDTDYRRETGSDDYDPELESSDDELWSEFKIMVLKTG